jgi:hypothetical protein
MNAKEFHQLNKDFFKPLEEKGFQGAGSNSKWVRNKDKEIGIEFALRLDRYGWTEQYGSSFIYEVLPWYKGKPVLYYPAQQLRLHELSQFSPEIIDQAEAILSNFSAKIPRNEDSEDSELFVFLKSNWTKEKIVANIGHWYYFYDKEDILAWHNATYSALLTAIDAMQAKYEDEDFEHRNNRAKSDQFEKMTLLVDSQTGEVTEKTNN